MKELIEQYLKIDDTSKTGLRWIKDRGKVKAGDEAMTAISSSGYYQGRFNGAVYQAHQMIMYLETGIWSSINKPIDHIDGNKLTNKRSNLRFVTPTSNQRNANRAMQSNNTSGIKGLFQYTRNGNKVWIASYAGRRLYEGKNKEVGLARLNEARTNDSQYLQ